MATISYTVKAGDKFSVFTGQPINYSPGTVIYGDYTSKQDFGTSTPVSQPIQSTPAYVAPVSTNPVYYNAQPSAGISTPAPVATMPTQPTTPSVSQGTSTQNTQQNQYNIGNTTLTRGSKGEEVKQLQQALNASGIGVNLKVDGIFGPATEAAVRAYQTSKGIKSDGIVGQQTIATLGGTPNASLSPVNQTITESINNDSQQKALYDGLTPELKSAFDALTMQISSLVEQGQKVNPDLTITPELTAKFLEQATSELDPYYQELIRQNKQDLSTSFQQLQEDYNKSIARETPAFQNALESADNAEANAGVAFSSGRIKREGDLITNENQKLADLFTTSQRAGEQNAVKMERKIGSRAFGDLGIPSLQQYSTQPRTISPSGSIQSTGSRNLYTPQTGLYGEIPASAKTAINTRSSALEEAEIKKRILDAGYGLGSTSLG